MRKFLLAAVAMLTMTTSAFAAIGDLSADLVFTPITPCRIADTRNAGGAIAGGATRPFLAWNSTFASQGGAANNCGIPQSVNVAAVAVNLLVISPAGNGWIAAWPYGLTQPNVSNLNYNTGDVLANSAILKIGQAGAAFDFNVYSTHTTHFVADVTGYYAKPITTALTCTTQTAAINITASPSTFNVLTPSCPANSTLTGGGMDTGFTSASVMFYQSSPEGSGWRCRGRNVDWTSTWGGTCYATCCSIPGR